MKGELTEYSELDQTSQEVKFNTSIPEILPSVDLSHPLVPTENKVKVKGRNNEIYILVGVCVMPVGK